MKRKINFLKSTLSNVIVLAVWCQGFNVTAQLTNHSQEIIETTSAGVVSTAISEIALLRATVAFSTTTPKSGDKFFMDIRINSASLGSLSGLIEDLHVEFDLPNNLSVVMVPLPFGSEFSVDVNGSHVEINWNDAVPIGAPQRLRFTLAWNAGVTLEGIDTWAAPTIYVNALNCIGAIASNQNSYDPVPDVYPVNDAAINYVTTEYQDVYAALLHIATIKLKNEHTSGGLNLHDGIVTLDLDSGAYIPTIRLNGAVLSFTELENTPIAGRKTIIINIPDSDLQVDANWNYNNTLQLIYNYPPDIIDDGIPIIYNMNITYTAVRANGEPINETHVIREEVNYRVDAGPAISLFSKIASEEFVRVIENTLSYIISFDAFAEVQDIEITDDPRLNEPDFFNAFRFTRVEVSAYDPFVHWSTITRTRTKIYYEHSGNLNMWYEVPSTEVTAAGDYQYSWSGSSLTSASLDLGEDYVTRVKFEFYKLDGTSRDIPASSGKVQIRLFATATSNILDNTTSNSYNNDNIITNTITASGVMGSTPFNATDVTITTSTRLTANLPILNWKYQNDNWYYANGAEPDGSWYLGAATGEWNSINSAGGGSGLVRIGDETWVTEQWLIEGGYFHDPIAYFYVPDPNIEILGVGTGPSLHYSDVEYFDAPNGGYIVKFRLKNAINWVPGNPEITYPTPGWDNYLPAFGAGDPGGYGWNWGHWWVWRGDDIALKIKFKSGVQNSNVSGNIELYITSGDPEQIGSFMLAADNPLVVAGAARSGQTVLSSRGFGYIIDYTAGLNPITTVSRDNILYVQTETVDNSLYPVDVYLKMRIENPASEIYGNLSKIRVINMLPYADDVMVITNTPKSSTGSLTGYMVYSVKLNDTEIPFADLATNGIRVYHSTTANFITNRQELRDVTVAVASHWTQTMNGTIPDGTKTVMIEKDGLFQGDELKVILKATAPVDSNTSKYWHSFAAGGRYGTANIIPGEPFKAGITGLSSHPVTISGRVWDDINRNGVQDTGEPGYSGLTMRLYDNQNNEVDMTVTDSNGEYTFIRDFDANSTWHIQFILPEDYVLTQYHAAAATETTNSNYIIYQGVPTVFFTFNAAAEDINNIDAGIYNNNIQKEFITLNLTLFLQGVVQPGSVMTNHIQNPDYFPAALPDFKLPTTDPYGVSGATYAQINNPSGPAGEIVDWILVEIWSNFETSDLFVTHYDLLESQVLLLKTDGTVVDTNNNKAQFLPYLSGNVRIIVKHRNHLSVMTHEMSFDSDIDCDFSTGIDKAFKSPYSLYDPMVMRHGVACLWAGDLNMDDLIDNLDVTNYDIGCHLGTNGSYIFQDVNMDGFIDNLDGSFILQNARYNYFSPARFFIKR